MGKINVISASGTTVTISILSRDHCPPHATCRENSGLWLARVEFSFLNNDVALMDVMPPQYAPRKAVTDALENDILRQLPDCRALWWQYQEHNQANHPHGPCCLHNQMFKGKRINTAVYNPATRETRGAFDDGTQFAVPL